MLKSYKVLMETPYTIVTPSYKVIRWKDKRQYKFVLLHRDVISRYQFEFGL